MIPGVTIPNPAAAVPIPVKEPEPVKLAQKYVAPAEDVEDEADEEDVEDEVKEPAVEVRHFSSKVDPVVEKFKPAAAAVAEKPKRTRKASAAAVVPVGEEVKPKAKRGPNEWHLFMKQAKEIPEIKAIEGPKRVSAMSALRKKLKAEDPERYARIMAGEERDGGAVVVADEAEE